MNAKNMKTLKIIILSLAGLTILFGAGYVYLSWNQPLDTPLNLPTETLRPDQATLNSEIGLTETVIPTIAPSPTIETVCGGPPSMNILVSGVASGNYLYGLADAVRIVRVDFQNPGVSVLALPRDLWVSIPGLENQGISVGKLNQAYFYGTEGMGYYDGSGFGSGLLAETIMLNYGFRADNYLAVNLSSFRKIIDALGGIDVYLAGDVYKRVNGEPKLFLKAGSHHLNGWQAEMLARQRITIGDFGRINNQTVILRAVATRLLSPSGITSLPALVDQLRTNVKTDLSPGQIAQIICLAGKIDYQEDIDFPTLPADILDEQRVFDPARGINTAVLIGDEEKIRSLMIDFQNGVWP
jgi:LCP family protein required for cell wall assembly